MLHSPPSSPPPPPGGAASESQSSTAGRRSSSSATSPPCPLFRLRSSSLGPESPKAVPAFVDDSPFRLLPVEILHHLLGYLPLPDAGNLALTSEWMRVNIWAWSKAAACLRRVQVDHGVDAGDQNLLVKENAPAATKDVGFARLKDSCSRHHGYAVLLKRVTCLMSTQERVRVAFSAFDVALKRRPSRKVTFVSPCDEDTNDDVEMKESGDWFHTLYTARFSTMMHVFTRGWDESEYSVLVLALDRKFGLDPRLRKFFSSTHRHDVCVGTEMHLRLTMRCLTWDFAGGDYAHRATWLIALMKRLVGQSPNRQALVFYLLFGPACQDGQSHHDNPQVLWEGHRLVMTELNNHADWEGFVDNAAEDFHDGKDMFYTLAQAVCSCMTAVTTWREFHLVPVLDQLFLVPSPWKRENVAGFLLFCSEKLILEYLQRKLDRSACFGVDEGDDDDDMEDCSGDKLGGNVKLVARLLVDMIVMSYRFDNELNPDRGIGKIFDTVCTYPPASAVKPGTMGGRERLFRAIWSSISAELEERVLDTADEEDLIDVLQGFGTHIMKTAYIGSGDRTKQEDEDVGAAAPGTPDTVKMDLEEEVVELMEE